MPRKNTNPPGLLAPWIQEVFGPNIYYMDEQCTALHRFDFSEPPGRWIKIEDDPGSKAQPALPVQLEKHTE
jgi:hypothetical protein